MPRDISTTLPKANEYLYEGLSCFSVYCGSGRLAVQQFPTSLPTPPNSTVSASVLIVLSDNKAPPRGVFTRWRSFDRKARWRWLANCGYTQLIFLTK